MNRMHCSLLLIDEKRVSVSLAFGIECSEGKFCADEAATLQQNKQQSLFLLLQPCGRRWEGQNNTENLLLSA